MWHMTSQKIKKSLVGSNRVPNTLSATLHKVSQTKVVLIHEHVQNTTAEEIQIYKP